MFAGKAGAVRWSAQVDAEVRYQIKRLSHHASIALWDACNECKVRGQTIHASPVRDSTCVHAADFLSVVEACAADGRGCGQVSAHLACVAIEWLGQWRGEADLAPNGIAAGGQQSLARAWGGRLSLGARIPRAVHRLHACGTCFRTVR